MFSRANFAEVKNEENGCKGNEVTDETIEKLQKMILGKDKNIDSEYVKDFYVNIAQGVGFALIFSLKVV